MNAHLHDPTALFIAPPADPDEPRQRDGESWFAFYDRWAASPAGRARIAYGRRLNAVLAPLHAAEKAGKYLVDPF